MTQPVFNAIVAVIDRASAPLRQVSQNIGAVGQVADATGAKIDRMDHPHVWSALRGRVTLLRTHFASLDATVAKLHGSFAAFLPMLGALGAGGTLVGLFGIVDKVAQTKAEAIKTAAVIGILPKQLAALNVAAKLSDISVETMQGGLTKLNKAIAGAASGENKKAAAVFAHIGFALRDSHGHMKTVAEAMPALADAFKKTADPAMRTRIAMLLFGNSGAEMLPMLMQGAAGMAALADEARKLNYVATATETEGLLAFHHEMQRLGIATGAFATQIGSKLAPILAPVIGLVVDWVSANRDWIATGIVDKVTMLADAVRAIMPHLRGYIEAARDWIAATFDGGNSILGFKAAIGGFLLLIGSPALIAIAALATAVTTIGTALSAVSMLLLANPIGLTVTVIAGLAYAIYKNWDHLAADFAAIWDAIGGVFDAGWARIRPIVNALRDAVQWAQRNTVGLFSGAGSGAPVIAGPGAQLGLPTAPRDAAGAPSDILPSPYFPGLGTTRDGKMRVDVTINGLPSGATATVEKDAGSAGSVKLNTGPAFGGDPLLGLGY